MVEVILAFVATHMLYRALKQFTLLGDWERAAATNFIPGAVFVTATMVLMFFGRRSYTAYGMSLWRWRRDLPLGLICSVVMLAVAAMTLALTGADYDPSRPPDPQSSPPWLRLLGALALGLIGLLTLLGAIRREELFEKVPPLVNVALLIGMAAAPSALAVYLDRAPVWPASLWLFFGAGVGEEMFFRGYIQSRVDESFGKSCRWLGCDVGCGLFVSALLFGLTHALNTVNYFEARWDFGWWYGLQNVFVGLLYGCLRARTRSIWAGAVTHGLLDVLGMAPMLIRGA